MSEPVRPCQGYKICGLAQTLKTHMRIYTHTQTQQIRLRKMKIRIFLTEKGELMLKRYYSRKKICKSSQGTPGDQDISIDIDIIIKLYDIERGDKMRYSVRIVKFPAISFQKHPYPSSHQFLNCTCVLPKGREAGPGQVTTHS